MGIFSWAKKKDKARDRDVEKLFSIVDGLETSNARLKETLLELQRYLYFEVRCVTDNRLGPGRSRYGYFCRTLNGAVGFLCDEESKGIVLRRGKLVGYSFFGPGEFIESEGGIPDESISLYSDMVESDVEEYWVRD